MIENIICTYEYSLKLNKMSSREIVCFQRNIKTIQKKKIEGVYINRIEKQQ